MPSAMKQAAIASVSAGLDQGATLTVAQFIHLMEQSYTSHVKRAEILEANKAKLRHRLFWARALECAAVLVDYYRRIDMLEDMGLWERRRRRAEARAFNHRATIAANIGAGPEEDGLSRA